MEEWDAEPSNLRVAEVPEIKLFGRWSADDIQVSDISLTVGIVVHLQNLHILKFVGVTHNHFENECWFWNCTVSCACDNTNRRLTYVVLGMAIYKRIC